MGPGRVLLAAADTIGERRLPRAIAPLFERGALGDAKEMMQGLRHGPERAADPDWQALTGIMRPLTPVAAGFIAISRCLLPDAANRVSAVSLLLAQAHSAANLSLPPDLMVSAHASHVTGPLSGLMDRSAGTPIARAIASTAMRRSTSSSLAESLSRSN